jgi:hypothetical protein
MEVTRRAAPLQRRLALLPRREPAAHRARRAHCQVRPQQEEKKAVAAAVL